MGRFPELTSYNDLQYNDVKLTQMCFQLSSVTLLCSLASTVLRADDRLTLIDEAAAATADDEVLSTVSVSIYANMRCDADGGTAAATAAIDCSGTRINIILFTFGSATYSRPVCST